MDREELFHRLVEQHRPFLRRDPDSFSGNQFLVQCRACDGNQWQIWRSGDQEYMCQFWRSGVELGLVAGTE